MPLTAAGPPQRVPVFSGFDYMTVDERRHRVYAAHYRSNRLLVVDSARDVIAGQVDVGPMHGLAVEPQSGDVFTGNGGSKTVSRVDPVAMKVLASVNVPGSIDAIAYDPLHGRIYADQSGGGNVYVIDGATMKIIATLAMPANDLESPSVDPATGTLFQNLADGGGFAIIDPATLTVSKVVKTPQLTDPHPLVFSPASNQVIAGGVNGVLSAYTPDGTLVGNASVPPRIDQCSTGSTGSLVACAGRGVVTVVAAIRGRTPRVVATLDTGHPGIHTVAIDEAAGDVWIVWSDSAGDWVQRLHFAG